MCVYLMFACVRAQVRAPANVIRDLMESLHTNMATARYEDTPDSQIDVIGGDMRPKFIDQDDLNRYIAQYVCMCVCV